MDAHSYRNVIHICRQTETILFYFATYMCRHLQENSSLHFSSSCQTVTNAFSMCTYRSFQDRILPTTQNLVAFLISLYISTTGWLCIWTKTKKEPNVEYLVDYKILFCAPCKTNLEWNSFELLCCVYYVYKGILEKKPEFPVLEKVSF